MKKLLSLLFVAVLATGAWASEVVFDASVDKSGNTNAGNQTITKSGVTINVTNGILGTDDGQYRCYKNQTLTISSSTDITCIEFICTANNDAQYGPGCFDAPATGSYSYEGKVGTWTGTAKSIAFKASKNQVRATKIIVTLDDGTISAPSFSPAPGTYYGPTNVKINGQEGTTVYYTTDGTDPTTASTVYSEPINVTQTTTIKAIAAKDNVTSDVATATYTIATAPSVANIAAFAALNDNDNASISNPVVVTYSNGSNTYVKDASGFLCIYANELTGKYTQGDVIPAGFGGKKTTFHNGAEMQYPVFGFEDATSSELVVADEVTVSNFLTQGKIWQYVVLKGATISYENGKYLGFKVGNSTDTIAGYNNFSLAIPDKSATYDIYGIITSYDGKLQLNPTEFVDLNPTYVDNIAGLLEIESGKNATFRNPVTAIFHSGKQLYIMDDSGFMRVYGSLSKKYNNGDQLTGIAGSWHENNGMTEMIPVASTFGDATPGTPVEPSVIPIEEINDGLVHNFLKIENCSIDSVAGSKGRNFTITDDSGDMLMRLNFSEVSIGEDFDYSATYNISGFLALYNGTMQLYPSAIEKATVPGDVNGDGVCNGADVSALYNWILNNDDSALVNGDQNNDTEINGADITAVYNIILGLN